MSIFDWFRKKLSPKKTKDKNKGKVHSPTTDYSPPRVAPSPKVVSPIVRGVVAPAPRFTAWCDDSYSRVVSSEYLDKLQETGIHALSIMVNKSNVRSNLPPWELKWSIKQFETVAQKLKDRGVDVALTKWPQPSRVQIAIMEESMQDVIQATDPCEIEDDTEANWRKKFLQGFDSMEEASSYLRDSNLGLKDYYYADSLEKIVCTSFPGHPEMNPEKAFYSKMCDLTRNQLYGVRHRGSGQRKREIDWDDKRLGPGGIQTYYLPKSIELGPEAGCGLPCYDLRWPGHTKEEALVRQFEAAREFDVTDFGLWSTKWIIGKFEQPEVAEAIKKITERG